MSKYSIRGCIETCDTILKLEPSARAAPQRLNMVRLSIRRGTEPSMHIIIWVNSSMHKEKYGFNFCDSIERFLETEHS